jgi:hypothetical protein
MNNHYKAGHTSVVAVALILGSLTLGTSAIAVETSIANTADTIPVTLKNYKVAESDLAFGGTIKLGGVNKLRHLPVQPFDLKNQTVVRMNQDTIYSGAVIDVSKGASITLPEADGRYQAVMIVQNDHYVNDVFLGAGTYEIKSDTKSDFVLLAVRKRLI